MLDAANIPQVLQDISGTAITSPEAWEANRERLLSLLSREEYGFLPPPPERTEFKLLDRQTDCCAGKAVYEKWEATVWVKDHSFSFPFFGVIPQTATPSMAFLHLNFRNQVPDFYMPTEEIIDGGFAVFSFGYEDVTKDNGDFSSGLAALFPEPPGKLALWAWAALRVRDHMAQREEIDQENVAVVGHSRLGKTALLAGAWDERFAFVIANESGCSGGAVTRGKQGERIADITRVFPFWFCENYRKYAGKEEELPFDQHFLLALIAPRKLYICDAQEDIWADPAAEFLSCRLASPVYELYGKQGLMAETEAPVLNKGYHAGEIGYHLRAGCHYLSRQDWQQFMAFLKAHRN